MPQFLTPEHHSELADILTRAHSQGAQESDLTQIRDHYLQQRSLTDRNYGEMRRATDSPTWSGGVGDVIRGAGQEGLDMAKGATSGAIEDLKQHPADLLFPPAKILRIEAEMAKRAGGYGKRALSQAPTDPAGAAVSGTQAALSLIPGISQAVPVGEHLKNTGDVSDIGRGLTQVAATAAPAALGPLSKMARAGSEGAYASNFAPEAAAGDVSAASKALANEAPVVLSNRSLARTLASREAPAKMAVAHEEAGLEGRGNQIAPKKVMELWRQKGINEAGIVKTPKGPVAGNPELMAALEDDLPIMKALVKPGGMTAAEALRFQRGARGAAASAGGKLSRSGGANPDMPLSEPPAATAARLRAEAIEPQLAKAAPELDKARAALHEVITTKNLPLNKPASLYSAGIAGGIAGTAAHSIGAGAGAAVLYKILASPAAKTLTGASLSHISNLLKAGDITSATAVAQAALASSTNNRAPNNGL